MHLFLHFMVYRCFSLLQFHRCIDNFGLVNVFFIVRVHNTIYLIMCNLVLD